MLERIRKETIDRCKVTFAQRKIGLVLNKTERPQKTIIDLFKFRNQIAHGKSEFLTEQFESSIESLDKQLHEVLDVDWEKKIKNDKFAKLVRTDVKLVMERIHEHLTDPKEYLLTFGMHKRGAQIVRGES